jgi:hypothetical protein
MLLLIIALLLFNIIYYEYRVIKGTKNSPKDITEAYGKLAVRKRYYE